MSKTTQYIYKTEGVCVPEIHFKIRDAVLESVRFVGGGCPGNAQLVARLLAGKPLADVLDMLKDIDCRNGTSCPDQFSKAIRALQNERLRPATPFRVEDVRSDRCKIGLLGEINSNNNALKKLTKEMSACSVEAIYCTGNLCGQGGTDQTFFRMLKDHDIRVVLGDRDWAYAQGKEGIKLPFLGHKERDYLARLPHVSCFRMAGKTGMTFFGDYLQRLPDYSDYEPFALEINLVCGLTNFMQDEEVLPALEAMIPQFQADIIVFGQTKIWGHWQIADKDFISLGPAVDDDGMAWGLLEMESGKVMFTKNGLNS